MTCSLQFKYRLRLREPMTPEQVEQVAMKAVAQAISEQLGRGGGNMVCLARGEE